MTNLINPFCQRRKLMHFIVSGAVDFDSSMAIPKEGTYGRPLTYSPGWSAKEITDAAKHMSDIPLGLGQDVLSLFCIAVSMTTGGRPPLASQVKFVLQKVLELKALARAVLVKDSTKRPCAKDALEVRFQFSSFGELVATCDSNMLVYIYLDSRNRWYP